jgi:hypothetical protein
MGLFVDRVASEGDLDTAVLEALRADPDQANDPKAIVQHIAAARRGTKVRTVYHWSRIIVGILIAVVLLAAGVVLGMVSDNWAADQATKAATIQGYKAPTSNLSGIATSIIALGSAWSGALVGQVLDGKNT